MLGRLAADVRHRLDLDVAPFREVGQRAGRASAPRRGAAAGQHALHVLLDVFLADAAARPRAGDALDVDAELARIAAHRRRGRHHDRARHVARRGRPAGRDVDDRGGSPRRRTRLRSRLRLRRRRALAAGSCSGAAPAVAASERAAVLASRFASAAAAGAGAAGLAAASPFAALAAGASVSACAAPSFSDDHDLADFDLVARLDADFGDRPAGRRRHLDRGLVGLELENACSAFTTSPGFTRTRTTSPFSMFSPSSGSFTSIGHRNLFEAGPTALRRQAFGHWHHAGLPGSVPSSVPSA